MEGSDDWRCQFLRVDNPDGWVFQAERYFFVNHLSNVEKLDSATLCFEGANSCLVSVGTTKAMGEELGGA